MNDTDNMVRRVALFRSQYGSVLACEMDNDNPDKAPIRGWIRVSDWQDVTFSPLSASDVVAGELKSLREVREALIDGTRALQMRANGYLDRPALHKRLSDESATLRALAKWA